MPVLEHDKHRVVACEPIEHRDETRSNFVHERGLVATLTEPEEQRQALGRALGRGGAGRASGKDPQALANLVGAVTRTDLCEVGNDRRFPSVSRCVAAVYDLLNLVSGDDPADYRMRPVVIRGNQSSDAIVQLQGRIKQWVGNPILSELRTYRSNNHPL